MFVIGSIIFNVSGTRRLLSRNHQVRRKHAFSTVVLVLLEEGTMKEAFRLSVGLWDV